MSCLTDAETGLGHLSAAGSSALLRAVLGPEHPPGPAGTVTGPAPKLGLPASHCYFLPLPSTWVDPGCSVLICALPSASASAVQETHPIKIFHESIASVNTSLSAKKSASDTLFNVMHNTLIISQ